MEAKPTRTYEDFDPVCKWRRDEGRGDTLEVHLPGFRREHIRVQVNHFGFIIISGERPLDGTRWKRFRKQVELPLFSIVDSIHANFTQSILSVVMPKKIPSTSQKEQEIRPVSEDEIQEKKEEEQTGSRRFLHFRGWSIRELEGRQRHHEDDHIDAADDHHQHDHHRQHEDDRHRQHEDDRHRQHEDDRHRQHENDHHQHDHHRQHEDDQDHQHDQHRQHDGYQSVEHDHSGLSPETTKDVAFKLMIVVIVILVITSYITDLCKSIMAHSLHN